MQIKCEIKGLNKLDRKINKIANRLAETTKQGVIKASNNTKVYALRLLSVRNDGIVCELVNYDTKEVKARIYTDQEKLPWSWFREFGTGQYAEQPHIGKSKHFIETGYEQWFIPVDKVESPLGYPIITIQGMQFYIAHGVKAKPFMTPAGFERRQENVKDVAKEIKKMLEEVCK